MRLDIKFKENAKKITTQFGEVYNVSDGGYERGYTEGEKVGYSNGYTEGETKGIEQGYANGKADGYADGYEIGNSNGVEQGKQAEYDAFWDTYQLNGDRSSYAYLFAGAGWNETTFKPKYDIKPKNAQYMFRYSNINADLVEILEKQGVVLDISGITNTDRTFADCKFVRLGVLDFSNVTAINTTFANTSTLVTIDKIILKDDGSNTFSTVFTNLSALENITFEGVIGKGGINFQWSNKISRASIESIINALSTTTSGLTVTLSKTGVNKAIKLVEPDDDSTTSGWWAWLIGTKPNWTISLV